MTDYIKGTNIPVNKWKGTDEELEDVERRIAEDIAKGDWDGANDALFTAAYGTVKGGQGQGNGFAHTPRVGAITAGRRTRDIEQRGEDTAMQHAGEVEMPCLNFEFERGPIRHPFDELEAHQAHGVVPGLELGGSFLRQGGVHGVSPAFVDECHGL